MGLRRRLAAVRPTREVTKSSMINNATLPRIDIDPETFEIDVAGERVVPAPAEELPLARLYSMF